MKKLTTRWYYTLKEAIEAYNEEKELDLDIGYLSVSDSEGASIGLSSISQRMLEILDEQHTWAADSNEAVKMFTRYLWPEYQDATIAYVDTLVNPWELGEEQEAPDFEEVEDEINPILIRFIRWIVESSERYSVLINAYENIENKLMAKVEVVSEMEGQGTQSGTNNVTDSGTVGSTVTVDNIKNHGGETNDLDLHNDTPQNGGQYFAGDPYVSDANRKTHEEQTNDAESGTTTTTGTNSTTTSGENSTLTNSSSTSVVGSDVNTPIERLDEIRKKLHNLYVDWANEFSEFVIYAD